MEPRWGEGRSTYGLSLLPGLRVRTLEVIPAVRLRSEAESIPSSLGTIDARRSKDKMEKAFFSQS